MNRKYLGRIALLGVASLPLATFASSHREAPFITTRPKVDATDFYMFNSYETGRAGYVTLIANYQPFEDPAGRSELLHDGSQCPVRDHASTTTAAAKRH